MAVSEVGYMKKLVALALAAVMAFCFCACESNPYSDISESEFSQKIDSGEFGTFVGFYSVKNEDRSDKEFWLQLSSAMENSELYSSDGLVVKFVGEKRLYDEDGNLMDEEDLKFGDTLIVSYNLKKYGDDPITVKAYKVEKMKIS